MIRCVSMAHSASLFPLAGRKGGSFLLRCNEGSGEPEGEWRGGGGCMSSGRYEWACHQQGMHAMHVLLSQKFREAIRQGQSSQATRCYSL